jgi:eukaryotic-like serine/threonine-protein kinase
VLIGAGGIAWQARQTAIERDIALAEARRSESIVRMLTVMFRDTATKSGEDATVKQMLDQTATQLVGSLDTSAKSATLIATLFDLYVNLEDSAGADALIRRALAKGIGKGDPVATAQLKMRQASAAAATGKTDKMAPLLDAAEAVFRTDPARFRSELVEINSDRAQLLRRTGKLDDAIKLLFATLPQANVVYAENHRDLLTMYNNLLAYLAEANRTDEMLPVFSEAEAILKRTGQEGTVQGLQIHSLKGVFFSKRDELSKAEDVFAGVLQTRRLKFGRSIGLSVDLLQLARVKLARGKFAEAEPLLIESSAIAAETLGPAAMPTLVTDLSLAEAQAELGKTAAAQMLIDRTDPLIRKIAPKGPLLGTLLRCRAILRLKQGRTAEALSELTQAETVFREAGPAGEAYTKKLGGLRARIVQ